MRWVGGFALAEIAPKILPYARPVWRVLDERRLEGDRILFEAADAVFCVSRQIHADLADQLVGVVGDGVQHLKRFFLLVLAEERTTLVDGNAHLGRTDLVVDGLFESNLLGFLEMLDGLLRTVQSNEKLHDLFMQRFLIRRDSHGTLRRV